MNLKGKQTKSGFTLIELLAVIVILAIIALIATPIVLNMIESARKSAAKSAAYGYIEAIEYNNVFAELSTDAGISGYTKITTGDVSTINTALGTHIKGKKPDSGSVTVGTDGKVTSAEFCISGYTVTYAAPEITNVDKGCSGSSTPAATYTAYSVGQSINYNPVTGTINCENPVSTTGTKEGCMKWYVISASGTNDTTVDLILDHNTTAKVAWNSNGSNASMGEVATALSTDTTGWTSGLNSRLITADEIAHIVGADSESTIKWSSSKNYGTDDIETKSSWIYLDGGRNSDPTVYASGSNGWQKQYANSSTPSNYAWLFDYTNGCESNGCSEEDSSNYGYWTSSPVSDGSNSAWFVYSRGGLSSTYVDIGSNFGVRPVITLSKSEFSS